MNVITTVAEVRQAVRAWKSRGDKVAFVPTMGNLPAGHLRLVEEARQMANRVIVSIFVNPLQFGENEDFSAYPRTLNEDIKQLDKYHVDFVFHPETKEIYPENPATHTRVEVPEVSNILCGAFRANHFVGVATVVNKLFNIVQPDVALFGKKDYQQLIIIQRMVRDLCMRIDVVGLDTVRERDGLAMSSRNHYLSEDERQRAPVLYQTLCWGKQTLLQGRLDLAEIEQEGRRLLSEAGFRPDYFSIREDYSLNTPTDNTKNFVIVAAAWLGKARLIDNIVIQIE